MKKTKTKEKASIGWRLTKIFLLFLRVVFNKPAGFFANFVICTASYFAGLHFSGGYHTISHLIGIIVVYPFVFEFMYKRFWEKSVKEVHDIIDIVVYSINNNFKDPNNSKEKVPKHDENKT